jgi:hypothetical protein
MSIPDTEVDKLRESLLQVMPELARRRRAAVPEATILEAVDDVIRHFRSMHGRVIVVDGLPACSLCGSRTLTFQERRTMISALATGEQADHRLNGDASWIAFERDKERGPGDGRPGVVCDQCGGILDKGEMHCSFGGVRASEPEVVPSS